MFSHEYYLSAIPWDHIYFIWSRDTFHLETVKANICRSIYSKKEKNAESSLKQVAPNERDNQ